MSFLAMCAWGLLALWVFETVAFIVWYKADQISEKRRGG